jgi:predicted protein tyrosine phosphatase
MIESTGARHLVSAIDTVLLPTTPELISSERHLRLAMHDIVEPRLDQVLPATEHVMQLLDFIHSWDRREPLLIHCYAGISRSTAAAFITLCALNPHTREELIASDLRRSSNTASPNRLFVALADKALRRHGRMIAAVFGMGQSRLASECIPFGLPAAYGRDGNFRVYTPTAA